MPRYPFLIHGLLLSLSLSACEHADGHEPRADGGSSDGATTVVADAGQEADVGASVGFDAGDVDAGARVDDAARGSATADAHALGEASIPPEASIPLEAGSGTGRDAAASRNGFPPVTDLGSKGPFATHNSRGEAEGPDCSIHRPAKLGEGGLRHPVLVWGMGTGGFNTYQEAFDLWASHGFIVAAALLGDGQGDGKEMLACLQHVCERYAPNVDCRAGASGHSQGGGGAIMTGADPRVIATAPIQAYTAQGFGGFDQASFDRQQGPMLLLSGTDDFIATPSVNQQPVFEKTNVPVVWANLIGGEHVTTGIDGAAGYRKVVLAWFRLQLMGDEDFRGMFYGSDCGLCKDSMWMVQRKGIP